jgi:hypothetical protein
VAVGVEIVAIDHKPDGRCLWLAGLVDRGEPAKKGPRSNGQPQMGDR